MSVLKLSDVFSKDADCVLYHGDTNDLLKQIPSEFVKLIVTSPPYNLGKSYESKVEIEEYYQQQKRIIKECVRVLSPEGSICWQVGNFVENGEIIPLDIILFPIFNELGLKLRNRIIWQFGHGLHASKRFSGRYEVILWFTKTDNYVFNLDPIRIPQKYPNKKHFKGPNKGELSGNPLGKNPADIWEVPNVKANHVEKTCHPRQFPVELIERLVLSLSNENDWIFDPFMGVGTTAIAALMHHRRVIGGEIMQEYVEIAKQRIAAAESGTLRIRPMERSVYDPNGKSVYIPPKYVDLSGYQQNRLFEKAKDEYQIPGGEINNEENL